MSDKRWVTKADILKDLAEMTGGYTDVDEGYIVKGEEPPPIRRYEDDDDELKLRFPQSPDPYEVQYENQPPDLHGITKFLRMVFDEQSDDEINRTPHKHDNTVITISKLDPNVPEFVPKGVNDSSPSSKKSLIVSNNNNNDKSEKRPTNNIDMSLKQDSKDVSVKDNRIENPDKQLNTDIDIKRKLDFTNMNAEEIKEISTKLRNKISVSKKHDLHSKKEKNVAIAALLKLHTVPLPENIEEKGPIKLFTPEYFASVPAAENNKHKEVRCEVHDVVINGDSKPTNNESTNNLNKEDNSSERSSNTQTFTSVDNETSTQSGKTSPKSYIESPSECDHFPHDPNIQQSIKKVTSWLQKPESPKPKGPVVHLGPISFKRKNITKSSISISDESSRSTPSIKAPNEISIFKPSKRAEDLCKMYSERAKALETRADDIWTKAMKEMQAIEKKKRAEKASSQSDSAEGGDGSSVSTN